MENIEWGILIVNYLFLGGVSAGLFFVSAFATWLEQKGDYTRIARRAALIAPWPVALGSLLLVFDLGKWHRFYKLFLSFRWQSPMSIGSWLLLLFTLVSLAHFCTWLRVDLSSYRRVIAAVGFPLSIGVAIYTGVLLGAVQARPFWNTNLVAQMFLFSALSTGCAVLILALSWGRDRLDPAQLRFLYTLDVCLIVLEFFVVAPYLVHGELSVQAVKESMELILGGPYTLAFWLLFMGLGLLAPLLLEIREIAPAIRSGAPLEHNRALAALSSVLVILGGYVLRYIFVYAGQISSFR